MLCCAVLTCGSLPLGHKQAGVQGSPEDVVVAEGAQSDQFEYVLSGDRGDLQQHTGAGSVWSACCCWMLRSSDAAAAAAAVAPLLLLLPARLGCWLKAVLCDAHVTATGMLRAGNKLTCGRKANSMSPHCVWNTTRSSLSVVSVAAGVVGVSAAAHRCMRRSVTADSFTTRLVSCTIRQGAHTCCPILALLSHAPPLRQGLRSVAPRDLLVHLPAESALQLHKDT